MYNTTVHLKQRKIRKYQHAAKLKSHKKTKSANLKIMLNRNAPDVDKTTNITRIQHNGNCCFNNIVNSWQSSDPAGAL